MAACSSSSGGSSSTGATSAGSTPSSAAAPTGKPVEINIVYPQTGAIAFPEMGVAIKAAENAINASGGINGHPLKVNVCDTQSPTDPNPTQTCMRKVAANKDIVAEVGDYSSFNDIVTPIENAAHMIQIGGVPLGASQQQLPNSYPLAMPEEEAFGAALVKYGSTKPGLIYIDIPTAQKAYSQINSWLKAGGSSVQLQSKQPAPLTATDLSPQVSALCGADGVSMSLAPTQTASFLQAHAQGSCPNQILVASALGTLAQLPQLGTKADGLILDAGLPFPNDTSSQGVQKFISQMNSVDPKAAKNMDSEMAWLSVWAFAQIARTIKGDVTRDSFWNATKATTTFQVFDMLPPDLDLSKGVTQVPDVPQITNHWVKLGKIQNGQVVDSGKGWVDVLNLAGG
jgi:branched-chain amino acid transport system substrate-binding protein